MTATRIEVPESNVPTRAGIKWVAGTQFIDICVGDERVWITSGFRSVEDMRDLRECLNMAIEDLEKKQ